MFDELLGQNVKASVKDGDKVMLVKGVYTNPEGEFLRITGELGTIYINRNDIIKIALWGGGRDSNTAN